MFCLIEEVLDYSNIVGKQEMFQESLFFTTGGGFSLANGQTYTALDNI